MEQMTDDDFEPKAEKLLKRLKKNNPQFDLYVEYGELLMKHIDSFTLEERKRYDELTEILVNSKKQ